MATGSSRATQEALLREVYLRDFRRQFNTKSVLLQSIKRNTRNFAPGKNISVAVHAGAGGTYQWTDNNELPPADFEQVERATFQYRMMTLTIEIAGDFQEDAKSKQAADIQPLGLEMRSALINGRHGLNYDLFGDGSGLLATPATATGSKTLTVDHVRGLRNNMRVDIIKTSDGSVGGGVTSAKIKVNPTTLTVTLTGDSNLANYDDVNSNPTTYGVYRHKSRNKAPFGLGAIVSAANPPSGVGNYGNIDRTDDANDFWRARYHDNGAVLRVPTFRQMQDLMDDIEVNSDGGAPNIIIAPHALWTALAVIMDNQKQFKGGMMTLNGWCKAIDWAGIPIVRDKHCPPDRMYFLDLSTFKIYQDDEGKWMDKDGAILARKPGYVAYEAAWYRRLQLVCIAPNANGCYADLKAA